MNVAGNKKPETCINGSNKSYYGRRTAAVISIKVNFLIRDIPQ